MNNAPYVCYDCYPDILFPYYTVDQSLAPKQRLLGEITEAIGDIIQDTVNDHVNSLENYVNTMEQNAINTVTEEIKKSSCFGFCKK